MIRSQPHIKNRSNRSHLRSDTILNTISLNNQSRHLSLLIY